MNNEPFEVIEHNGHKIELFYDYCYQDTPNHWDPETVCVCYDHRDFCAEPILGGYKLDSGWCQTLFEHWSEGRKTVEFGGINYWLFPVYLFSHDGQSLYLSRSEANQWEPTGFDTSFKGFCLVEKSNPCHWAKEDARATAKLHLESWNTLLSGDVYGYTIDGEGGCWGFFGSKGKDQMISEAKEEIEFDFKQN